MKIKETTTDAGNLIFHPEALNKARAIVVMIPGAFSRISMFDLTQGWSSAGYGLVRYRFPGLDGRPIAPALDIKTASDSIVALLARYPGKPVRMVGFSTGAAIAMTAGACLTGDVRIALMSPAVERGGGRRTFWRGLRKLLHAAWRARSLRRGTVWLEYYRLLLFGDAVLQDAALMLRADQIIEDRRRQIVVPNLALIRAHTRDLRSWVYPHDLVRDDKQFRIFWGEDDVVFDGMQIEHLAKKCGESLLKVYPRNGHLLFASCPAVFQDVFDFFEQDVATSGH